MNKKLPITNELLINYAHGLLEPNLAQQVKQALEEDSFWNDSYQGILLAMKDFPDKDPEEILEEIQRVKPEKTPNPIQPMRWKKQLFAVAASLLILLSIATLYPLYFSKNHHASVNELALATIQKPYHEELAVRGKNPADRWKIFFQHQQFDSVISSLSTASVLNPEEQFYLSLAYLKIEKIPFQKAETSFQKCRTFNSVGYTDGCNYYLGLIALANNKVSQGSRYLKSTEGNYRTLAEDLLREIK